MQLNEGCQPLEQPDSRDHTTPIAQRNSQRFCTCALHEPRHPKPEHVQQRQKQQLPDFNADIERQQRQYFLIRRQADICEFAPLRLNFKKGEMKDTFLHKQDKLKLVTHCNNKSEVYRQSVIKEFLAYRILNQLTDYSFRARLLRMTYVDTDTDEELEAYAFLIESAERLGKRLGMEPSTLQAVNEMRINQAHTNIGSVFQYMIVNLDFSAVQGSAGKPCCHNYTLFSPDKQAYWSIPYDFDKTGLAEPPHHGPSPEYKQRHVRDRKYRGRCRNNDFLPETMQVFRDGRDAIDALIANQEGLSTASRNRVESLVQSFYKEVDKESRLLRKLQKNCI